MMGFLEIAALASVLAIAATWLVVVLFARRPEDAAASPSRRAFSARAWLYAVFWVPPLVMLGALLPGLFGALTERGHNLQTLRAVRAASSLAPAMALAPRPAHYSVRTHPAFATKRRA